MSNNKPKSNVAWAGIHRGGGDLSQQLIKEMKELLDDFGIILENEANKKGINRFVLPIFREFNLVGALTSNEVFYAIAPSVGGLPTISWIDWQEKSHPKKEDFANVVIRELGWRAVSTLFFSRSILAMSFEERKNTLEVVAKKWINTIITEAERQARIVRLTPIFKGRDFLVENDLCFVLMPFKEPFFRIYEEHIKPTLEDLGLRVLKSDDFFRTTEIIEDIWEYINKAVVIIADVTGRNGNVFYELGLAHTVGKSVIILTQDENDVPFDLRHIRYFKYTDNEKGWSKLKRDLIRAIAEIKPK